MAPRHKLAALLILVLLPAGAPAQTTFGTILGTVTDETGAVVPNAKVSVRNLEENVVAREVTSDSVGNYEVQNLKASRYEITVTAAGFQKFTQTDVPLLARETIRVNVVLKVGPVEQQVTVEGAATVINTDTATLASSKSGTEVTTLPLNYRASRSSSPYRALATLPGVQSDRGTNFFISLNGALPQQTEISVDGISTIDVRSNRPAFELFPSAEGIAEMRVSATSNNAEYGSIADITTTSRGGANTFHGTAFEYLQNRALDAAPWGSPRKPAKVANDFGGSFGGPIFRNRTFFFVDYEGNRFRSGAIVTNTVPTQAMRNGDFSSEGVTIRDPLTGLPFTGNRIPDSRINSVAKQILELYPLPNFGRTDRQVGGNYRTAAPDPVGSNQYDIRVDHRLTNNQSVFARWTWKDLDSNPAGNLLLGPDTNFEEVRGLAVSYNYTISPRLLNEFRSGISKRAVGVTFGISGADLVKKLGLQGLGPNFPKGAGVPNVDFTGATTDLEHTREGQTTSRNIQFSDNLTWTKGRHTIKAGIDLRRLRTTDFTSFTSGDDFGTYRFEGAFTGSDFADFLLGLPDNTTIVRNGPDNNGNVWHYHFFVQDSFKLSPRWSLEYGIRYEYHPGFKDATFNITNFDRTVPVTGRVVVPNEESKKLAQPGFLNSINPCPGPAIDGVPCTPFITAKEAGWPDQLRFQDKNNWNPRLGFAFRPFNNTKTVIRGGAGIYTQVVLGQVFYSLTAIHTSDVTGFKNAIVGGRPLFQWPQSSFGVGAAGSPVGSADFRTANDHRYRDPYGMQWNLTVEQDLGWNTGLRVSHIGLRSINMTWAPDINQFRPSTIPFSQRKRTERTFPNWFIIFTRDQGATALYTALQTEVNHRFSKGLSFQSSWTWAKNLTDSQPAGSGINSGFASENGGGRALNLFDRRSDWGNVNFTRRHRFLNTFVWDVPVGRDKTFLRTAHPVAHAIVGGWQLSGILLFQTGPFLTPFFSGGDPSGTNPSPRGNQRPDALANGNLSDPTPDRFFNREAFICPGRAAGAADRFNCNVGAIGRFGNAAVGSLVGPGTIAVSLGFGKYFDITERAKLRFEGSFTNLPNHPNFDRPSNLNVTSSSFGRLTSVQSAENSGNRTAQFALRLEF